MTSQPLILALETSTLSCSVALFRGEQLLGARQISEAQHVHGKELLPLIDEVLRANEITSTELQGIAVSAGPGSYTGLRIGVSTAKGIAHAHNLPLMAFDSLHVQACAAASEQNWTAIIAVMDARRDEVYTASFVPEADGLIVADATRALILESTAEAGDLFPVIKNLDGLDSVCVIGDAAEKAERLLDTRMPNCTFTTDFPQAKHMHQLALEAYRAGSFEDVAYFEPRYLKEFQAGTPRDPLGLRTSSIS